MITFISKHKVIILLICILIIGIAVRVFMWPHSISQINCDEAMTAINAISIAETGLDKYGTSFPVYLEAWGGMRSKCCSCIFYGALY